MGLFSSAKPVSSRQLGSRVNAAMGPRPASPDVADNGPLPGIDRSAPLVTANNQAQAMLQLRTYGPRRPR